MNKRIQHSLKEYKEALIASKGIMATAAIALGVERGSVYKRVSENVCLQELLESVREGLKDTIEDKLIANALDGNEKAIEFFLERKAKDRGYGDYKEIKLDGSFTLDFEDWNVPDKDTESTS
jgi:hypothetical protein